MKPTLAMVEAGETEIQTWLADNGLKDLDSLAALVYLAMERARVAEQSRGFVEDAKHRRRDEVIEIGDGSEEE